MPLTSRGFTKAPGWRLRIGLAAVERTLFRCPPFNPNADEDVAKMVRRANGAIFMVAGRQVTGVFVCWIERSNGEVAGHWKQYCR